ncbi:tryptophan--tRNA ligase [uncultured Tyzzerella sp.]|uniref:tryptophan--tRNA ligase n=1 Tax=uncultured Tyzzerella sp. TaxID=2321398 RepID=UPI0029433D78|nr:tryptophan--tRNA ligase [uncultured Tyzzerella sp.]
MTENKKVLLSGMQPSGKPTLGNYLGAFKNWSSLQEEYDCIYFIADLHAITVRQDPAMLRKYTKELLALYLASGFDSEKNTIYIQSNVSAHAELAWILNCYSYMGELSRMTQFKDKSQKQGVNIPNGLFNYPILQAADILLYQTSVVPVGEDQRQHLELARDIAIRFNNIYGDVFTIPEMYIPKIGAKIMGLQNPTKKMSKSDVDNENNVIYLLDDLKTIANKIKRSVTDSDNQIVYRDDKPGIKNLLGIYCAITNKTVEDAEKYFNGFGYGAFKEAVAEVVVEEIRPIQERFKNILSDKVFLEEVIKNGAKKADYMANKTLRKVKKKVGFL